MRSSDHLVVRPINNKHAVASGHPNVRLVRGTAATPTQWRFVQSIRMPPRRAFWIQTPTEGLHEPFVLRTCCTVLTIEIKMVKLNQVQLSPPQCMLNVGTRTPLPTCVFISDGFQVPAPITVLLKSTVTEKKLEVAFLGSSPLQHHYHHISIRFLTAASKLSLM